MKMGFLPLLLVLLSGDVETNPGPLAPLARGPNLEKVCKMSEGQNYNTEKMDKTDKTDKTNKQDKRN